MRRAGRQTSTAPRSPAELTGPLHPLLDCIGSVQELWQFQRTWSAADFTSVTDEASFERFLSGLRDHLLFKVELPAIYQAYQHAVHHEVRELIVLDRELAQRIGPEPLASASRQVGQRQLQKLRPLRDQRVVQRYLKALDAGQAKAWHMIVYGLTLAVYSIPIRQGLVNYGHQTLEGFVRMGSAALGLSDEQRHRLTQRLLSGLADTVEQLVARNPSASDNGPALRLV